MSEPPVRIDKLSKGEKLELLERIWESLRRRPEDVPVTEGQRAEVLRRSQELDSDLAGARAAGIPWDEVMRQLRSRR